MEKICRRIETIWYKDTKENNLKLSDNIDDDRKRLAILRYALEKLDCNPKELEELAINPSYSIEGIMYILDKLIAQDYSFKSKEERDALISILHYFKEYDISELSYIFNLSNRQIYRIISKNIG